MRYLLMSLVLCGCGPLYKPHCTTSRNVKFMGMIKDGEWETPEKWSCDYFENAQNKIIEVLKRDIYVERNLVYNRLNNTEVWLQPEAWWLDETNRKISGVTYCDSKFIEMGNEDRRSFSAYAHELVHIIQNCNPPMPIDPKRDVDHADWDRDGINKAINIANLELNEENP